MPVAEGAGNAARFVCPYHQWTYELDGRLRSAPMMDGVEHFRPADCRLPALRVEVWEGFVLVNQDPHCEPLGTQLTHLQSLIGNYGFSELVTVQTLEFESPWNWKILVENFMEAYHHIGTHRQSFERVYPARDSLVEDNDGAPWALLRMPGHHGPDDAGGLPAFPGLTGVQRDELMAACVFPTLLLGASASTAVWYEVVPAAHDRMTLRIHVLLRPEVAAALDEGARAEVAEGIRFIHLEDVAANEGPWRGLHAPLTAQGRLSRYEKAIWQLNQLWADRMRLPGSDAAPETIPRGRRQRVKAR
jgi:phenylpropionate dioxygenase-like ring-hydroxylating dioxygenase large terminal subunit